MAIRLLDGRVYDKEHPMSKEEMEELLNAIPDDPEEEEEEEEEPQKFGNPLYDRWAADDESINKYGL